MKTKAEAKKLLTAWVTAQGNTNIKLTDAAILDSLLALDVRIYDDPAITPALRIDPQLPIEILDHDTLKEYVSVLLVKAPKPTGLYGRLAAALQRERAKDQARDQARDWTMYDGRSDAGLTDGHCIITERAEYEEVYRAILGYQDVGTEAGASGVCLNLRNAELRKQLPFLLKSGTVKIGPDALIGWNSADHQHFGDISAGATPPLGHDMLQHPLTITAALQRLILAAGKDLRELTILVCKDSSSAACSYLHCFFHGDQGTVSMLTMPCDDDVAAWRAAPATTARDTDLGAEWSAPIDERNFTMPSPATIDLAEADDDGADEPLSAETLAWYAAATTPARPAVWRCSDMTGWHQATA